MHPKGIFDWIKIKWIFWEFSVTFGLRSFHRGEGRWSKVSYARYYVLILNYFRGRLAVMLSIPMEFTHEGVVLVRSCKYVHWIYLKCRWWKPCKISYKFVDYDIQEYSSQWEVQICRYKDKPDYFKLPISPRQRLSQPLSQTKFGDSQSHTCSKWMYRAFSLYVCSVYAVLVIQVLEK